jgi:hypothetical protein
MTPLEATASPDVAADMDPVAAESEALRELDRPEETPGSNGSAARDGRAARDARNSVNRVAPQGSGLYGKVERLYDKIEAFVSRLSVRDNFWNSICSLIWLPLAFFSGIRLKALNTATKAFDTAADAATDAVSSARERVASSKIAAAAVLPFRRFNRNWYRAMAGGALLANSEIAGGMYVFGIVGGDYTVVCKHLEYRFLRPCFGPAVYRMTPRENVHELVSAGGEFNVTVDMDIQQQASRVGEKDKRVGQCVATFHVTPKVHHKTKRQRSRGR